jgi:hypothetical protein
MGLLLLMVFLFSIFKIFFLLHDFRGYLYFLHRLGQGFFMRLIEQNNNNKESEKKIMKVCETKPLYPDTLRAHPNDLCDEYWPNRLIQK